MNASLQKKGNIYYAVVSVSAGSGKYKTKWITTGCTKKTEASARLREILAKMERGEDIGQSKQLFVEFLQYWLDEIIKPQIEKTTYEGYLGNFTAHIKPYFEPLHLKVSDVKLAHLQKFINDLHKHGRKDGTGGLKSASIKKFMANVSKALDYAVKTGMIQQNPARYVDFPKDRAFVGSFYTVEEIEQLLALCKGTTIETPIVLAVHYGLRRGEIMGLRWQDLDFSRNTITICNTRVRIREEVEKPPKSESSRRTLPLMTSVKAYLRRLKETQEQDAALFGNAYQHNDYVCRWRDGHAMDVGYVNSVFGKLLKENGMRHIRFHDIRHSTASYLNKLGFTAKEIQIWLGHADIKTTMNIYTHVDIGMKKNIADRVDGMFGFF